MKSFGSKFHLFFIAVIILIAPKLASASGSYLTMPLAPADTSGVSSWFDHTSPQGASDASSTMTRSDGATYTGAAAAVSTSTNNPTTTCDDYNSGAGCYNGHEGIDFKTFGVQGKTILAAASGTVRQVGWQDPDDSSFGFGYMVHLYHSLYNFSTLYGHATSSVQLVNVDDNVFRGQPIAVSGCTGTCFGPHLHFQVYDNDINVSSTQFDFAHSVDPYGWSGSGSDPWTPDQGYLWASNPPSLYKTNFINSNISTTTTWNANEVYELSGAITVDSSSTLTILEGAKIKFDNDAALVINGGSVLAVNGTASNPVYFTSVLDDAVGGDTNGDGTSTSPSAGNWSHIKISSGASSTIDHAIIRYGGQTGCCSESFSDVYAFGGTINISNSTIASSTEYGILAGNATLAVSSSTLSNNGYYGIYQSGSGTITLNNNTFTNNVDEPVYVDSGDGITASGNTASGSLENGFLFNGSLGASETWQPDLPYIIQNTSGLTIPSGVTLTIQPGVIVKLQGNAPLINNGVLNASGNASSSVCFTSLYDDTVGGDTNNDGSSTDPTTSFLHWQYIKTNSGASTTLSYANIKYGSYTVQVNVYNSSGGSLTINNSTIASGGMPPTTYGIFSQGDTTITTSEITGFTYGMYLWSGSLSVSSSSIHGNSTYGEYNNTTATTTAEHNYWGDSSGPHNVNPSGAGDTVSTFVDYSNWLTSWP